ncbi:MAG: AAA family ATPase [Sulfurovum sp.]
MANNKFENFNAITDFQSLEDEAKNGKYINEYLQEKLIEIEKKDVYSNLYDKNLNYITDCNQETYLLYKTDMPNELLLELEEKIYLVAPGTQVFSFLDEEAKNTLFLSTINNNLENIDNFYDFHVAKSRKILTNFFTYDFASPTLIINSFKKARDKDFELAIENSNYENLNLKNLKNDLDNFLLNKTISVNKDLTRVIFKIKDTQKELNPEDLSHGELKKLGLFIWFKYNHLNDGIILMDEVENGLHPDWQYSITKDLEIWAPNNQFIIATHSYEVCQALTPAHISELNPKLLTND